MRRILVLTAILALCLSLCPAAAASEEPAPDGVPSDPYTQSGTCGDGLQWWLTLYGELIIEGSGPMTDFVAAYAPWYVYSPQIETITIGEGVTGIGYDAFNLCTHVTEIDLPASVTKIGDYAFSHCGLTQITIPASVETIGAGAFEFCDALTAIAVDSANPCYTSRDGVLYDRSETELVAYPAGREGSYTIPEGVTTVGAFAFSGCTGLTAVELPESLRTLESGAFYDCNRLDAVELPAGLASVGRNAFRACSSLREVTFAGSESAWGEVRIDDGNDALLAAKRLGEQYRAAQILRRAVGLPGADDTDLSAADAAVLLRPQAS